MDREKIKQKIEEIKKGCFKKFEKESIVNILTFGMTKIPKTIEVCSEQNLCPKCEKLKEKYERMLINKRKTLTCKKCGNTSFKFDWKYNEDEELNLYLSHDGIGFQLTDSIITCSKCGKKSKYEEENFLEAK